MGNDLGCFSTLLSFKHGISVLRGIQKSGFLLYLMAHSIFDRLYNGSGDIHRGLPGVGGILEIGSGTGIQSEREMLFRTAVQWTRRLMGEYGR